MEAEVHEDREDQELTWYFLLASVKAEESLVEYSRLICRRVWLSLNLTGMEPGAV